MPQFRRWLFPLVLLAAAAGLAFLFVFDPTRHDFYPFCVFNRFTGLNCPGCGATRALYSLLHGHLLTALHNNALFVIALPFLAYFGIRFLLRQTAPEPPCIPKPPTRATVRWTWALVAVILVFTILRNLPRYPFTLLAPLSPA